MTSLFRDSRILERQKFGKLSVAKLRFSRMSEHLLRKFMNLKQTFPPVRNNVLSKLVLWRQEDCLLVSILFLEEGFFLRGEDFPLMARERLFDAREKPIHSKK